MVCPNCHSDQVIAVQDQHFCISCGQMVPEAAHEKPKPLIAVQADGLPEGVKILGPIPAGLINSQPATKATTTDCISAAPKSDEKGNLIHGRSRLALGDTPPVTRPKHRKPGRPKAGKLDVPKIINHTTPAQLPDSPKIASDIVPTAPTPTVAGPPRRMSDLAPRKPPATKVPEDEGKHPAGKSKKAKAPRPHAHRVGVPPLHYGAILAFSLRARVRPRLVVLAAGAALSLGAASAYGVWILLTRGVSGLAAGVMHAGPRLYAEAILLFIVYYIGRSIGETAITYGIARESDQRPVSMSRQLGVAINTFGRRLALDLGFACLQLILAAAAGALLLTGGANWPIDYNIQIGLIFAAYLVILYGLSALALARGLAGVNLALTTHRPKTAAKIGWQLFSHRIELIGPRFGALLLELVLSVPLIALAVAFVVAAPSQYHLAVAIGAGLLAWLAGALLGVGTAAWWTTLYRQLVVADHPDRVVALLSGRQPEEARRGPLVLLAVLTTLLLVATLLLPWVKLSQ